MWTEELQESFEALKREFVVGKILAHPDPRKEFFLYTDASKERAGAVLAQYHIVEGCNVLRPIAFYSRKFSNRETS